MPPPEQVDPAADDEDANGQKPDLRRSNVPDAITIPTERLSRAIRWTLSWVMWTLIVFFGGVRLGLLLAQ